MTRLTVDREIAEGGARSSLHLDVAALQQG